MGFAFRSAFLLRRLLVLETARGTRVRARGRVPREVLTELVDVMERGKITAVIDVVLDGRRGARVRVKKGQIPAATLQQLRNAVGRFSRARLEAGTPFRLGAAPPRDRRSGSG